MALCRCPICGDLAVATTADTSTAGVAGFGLPSAPGDLQHHRLFANYGNPVLNRWTMSPGNGCLCGPGASG
jgi:hypothetical protein